MFAVATVIAVLAAGPESEHKFVDFVGFSNDESVAAWRVRVERPVEGGKVDHFSLIRLVNTANNQVLTDFRVGRSARRFARLSNA